MSEWNHAICDVCWLADKRNQQPCRLINPDPEFCCFCGRPTYSGIFVRRDPKEMACHGEHLSIPQLYRETLHMWRLICDFVACETSQTSYAELKGSNSMDIPCEFLALCEFAEEMGIKLP